MLWERFVEKSVAKYTVQLETISTWKGMKVVKRKRGPSTMPATEASAKAAGAVCVCL